MPIATSLERKVVRVAGVEPTTCGFGGRHSIQLSYTRMMNRHRKLGEFQPHGKQFDALSPGYFWLAQDLYDSANRLRSTESGVPWNSCQFVLNEHANAKKD